MLEFLLFPLKELNFSILLFLEFSLLLFLADVGLEILKLLLSGSFAFIVVHSWFWKGFYWSVSDGDEHMFLFFGFFFFPWDLLSFGLYFLFQSNKVSFIFDDDLVFRSISIIFFVAGTIFSGEKKGTSYKGFGLDLWFLNKLVDLLRHLWDEIYKKIE